MNDAPYFEDPGLPLTLNVTLNDTFDVSQYGTNFYYKFPEAYDWFNDTITLEFMTLKEDRMRLEDDNRTLVIHDVAQEDIGLSRYRVKLWDHRNASRTYKFNINITDYRTKPKFVYQGWGLQQIPDCSNKGMPARISSFNSFGEMNVTFDMDIDHEQLSSKEDPEKDNLIYTELDDSVLDLYIEPAKNRMEWIQNSEDGNYVEPVFDKRNLNFTWEV